MRLISWFGFPALGVFGPTLAQAGQPPDRKSRVRRREPRRLCPEQLEGRVLLSGLPGPGFDEIPSVPAGVDDTSRAGLTEEVEDLTQGLL